MLTYILTRILIFFVQIMPFRILYFFSDILYILLYKIVGYRRNIVHENLKTSFPEKTEQEVDTLEKKFYRHLTDIMLEGLKGFSMSKKQLIKRYKVINPELIDYYYDKGENIVVTPSHYNNWEWGALASGLQIKHTYIVLYMPMTNKYFDNYVKKHRAKFKTHLISVAETNKMFSVKSHAPKVFVMVADQSPADLKHCYRLDFLNHYTACIHGPEKLARRYNMPVILAQSIKIKRGYYNLKLVEITNNPKLLPDGEITKQYMQNLEKTIKKEPAYWLWSHKRWKHKIEKTQQL